MKNLAIRLTILLFPVVLVTILVTIALKDSKLEQIKTKKEDSLYKAYTSSLKEIQRTSDLIFFNNILYDDKIFSIYKDLDSSNILDKKLNLYNHIKDRFHYFKSYGIKQIKFYTKDKKLFVKMKGFEQNSKKPKESIYIKDENLDENYGFEVKNKDLVISFSKTLFNNDLKKIGFVKLEFDTNYLLNHIQRNIEYDVMFLFRSNNSNNRLSTFDLNNKYKYVNNRFNKIKYNKKQIMLMKEKTNQIESFMQKGDNLSFIYKQNGAYNFASFIGLEEVFKTDDKIYLFSYKTDETYIKNLVYNYFYLVVFLLSLYIIILALLYHMTKYKKQLRRQKSDYDYLLDAIDKYVVLVETNKRGEIVYVTEAFCDICGYSKDELLGENVNIIRHPDVSKKFFENLWRELYKNRKWEGEIKNMDKFGNSYWVKGTIFPKYDEHKRIKGFMSIRVNITDAKQLAKVNKLLKEDLSNKLTEIKIKDKDLIDNTKVALMSKVLDAVAHQWKKPISNISFELANLNAKVKALSQSNDLMQIHNRITQEMKLLSMTLNEFKSFFAKDASMDKYNLYQVTNEAIEIIKDEARDCNLTIGINTKKDIECYGIYNEFKHIMVSLIKNSIEETKFNKVKNPVVDISYIVDNSDILLKYEDNIQIGDNTIVEDVFDNDFDTKKDRGLNLYISKLLIEKTGATVWYEKTANGIAIYIKLISKDRRKNLR